MAAMNGSPQVDAQHPLPVLDREFADRRAAGADPGVVDHQRGRGAEPRLRLRSQIDNLVEFGYVAGDCDRVAADVGDRAHGSLGGDFIDVAADNPTATAASSTAKPAPTPPAA